LVGALAFIARQAGTRGRVAAFAYRYQAFLFFPLPLLEGLSLRVATPARIATPHRPQGLGVVGSVQPGRQDHGHRQPRHHGHRLAASCHLTMHNLHV
jgi:hypothetical protein